MKVSIGIPTYNRRVYLMRAIESALAQTHRDIELIVSDNASSDDTAEHVSRISDPRLVFLRQAANLGMTGNFNACLQAATGELFLMLSDDDILEPTCIERLSGPLQSSDVGVSWCPVKILDAAGKMKYETAAGPVNEPGWALVEGFFQGARGPRLCSMMVRTKDAVEVGGYRLEHGPSCDIGTIFQIALNYPLAVCTPEAISGYRVHASSTTSQPDGPLWQRSSERITDELVALLEKRGEPAVATRIRVAGNDNTSNQLAGVMIQFMGKPGWVKYWISEAIRAPKYLFAPVVFRRIFKDGWKLFRGWTSA